MRFPTGHAANIAPKHSIRRSSSVRVCDDGQADETIFLIDEVIRKRTRVDSPTREESYDRARRQQVLFSMSIFVAHAFDAYRTR